MSEPTSLIVGGFIGFISAVLSPIIATSIRNKFFGPRLEIVFSETLNGCVAKTKEKYTQNMQENPGVPMTYDTESYYVRARVTNSRKQVAKQCRACLVKVERWHEQDKRYRNTAYCDSIQLAWSCSSSRDVAYGAKDIPNGIEQFVDIISTRLVVPNKYRIEISPMPFRYEDLFSELGKFRFTILVTGENVSPVVEKMVFVWTGRWRDFQVRNK